MSHVENKFNDRSHELEHELLFYKKQIEKQQLQEQEKLKEQENIKALIIYNCIVCRTRQFWRF